jgi:DNA-binding NtrC family response regulator
LAPDQKRILVLDPDRDHAERVRSVLARSKFTATLAVSGRQALELNERRAHDAVLLDLDRAVHDRLIEAFRRTAPSTPILLIVDPARILDAVRLLREGADDYVLRPTDAFELRARLVRLLERHDLDSRLALLQHEVSKNYGVKNLVSHSPAMRAVLDRILRGRASARDRSHLRGERRRQGAGRARDPLQFTAPAISPSSGSTAPRSRRI